jgi:hypothetical protein
MKNREFEKMLKACLKAQRKFFAREKIESNSIMDLHSRKMRQQDNLLVIYRNHLAGLLLVGMVKIPQSILIVEEVNNQEV